MPANVQNSTFFKFPTLEWSALRLMLRDKKSSSTVSSKLWFPWCGGSFPEFPIWENWMSEQMCHNLFVDTISVIACLRSE